MFENLKADFARYYTLLPGRTGFWRKCTFYLECQGLWALVDYRLRKWLVRQPFLTRFVLRWFVFFNHVWVKTFTGIAIPTGVEIGKGLYIGHFSGIFIYDDVVMGEGCSLSQGVTIGLGGRGDKHGSPAIGNRVYFGPGAKVFGKITIGDGASVGANAVLFISVPAGAIAVGVPARIHRRSSGE